MPIPHLIFVAHMPLHRPRDAPSTPGGVLWGRGGTYSLTQRGIAPVPPAAWGETAQALVGTNPFNLSEHRDDAPTHWLHRLLADTTGLLTRTDDEDWEPTPTDRLRRPLMGSIATLRVRDGWAFVGAAQQGHGPVFDLASVCGHVPSALGLDWLRSHVRTLTGTLYDDAALRIALSRASVGIHATHRDWNAHQRMAGMHRFQEDLALYRDAAFGANPAHGPCVCVSLHED